MSSPDELYDRAVDCVAEGRIADAIACYRAALEQAPDFADAWEGLSMALADQGEWEEAIAAAKRVVEIDPDEQLGYTNVSRIYQRAGNVPEAEAWAARARVLDWKSQLKAGKS
ncbi:tetratricopeptide repeat protein [Candidatus Binatia bacterium]|nr:tetratricopeptide repeat protein [Candidatus Binatia bacterium]